MKLYFGNTVSTVTTILILGLLGFVGCSAYHHGDIQHWGRRIILLMASGLVVCCFAAARDGLDKTIQHAIDGSCTPGLFPLVSIPNIIGCIGALVIVIAAVTALIARRQQMREICFFMMSGGVVLKIVVVEIARIIL
ncbi:MAG: hypothetical protein ACI4W2_08290 [Eubacterium sp.]